MKTQWLFKYFVMLMIFMKTINHYTRWIRFCVHSLQNINDCINVKLIIKLMYSESKLLHLQDPTYVAVRRPSAGLMSLQCCNEYEHHPLSISISRKTNNLTDCTRESSDLQAVFGWRTFTWFIIDHRIYTPSSESNISDS